MDPQRSAKAKFGLVLLDKGIAGNSGETRRYVGLAVARRCEASQWQGYDRQEKATAKHG